MKRSVNFILTSLFFVAIVVACTESWVRAAATQAADKPRGLYTEAQSKRGETVYTTTCVSCHGATLAGRASLTNGVPPLAGDDFLDEWVGKTTGDLFERIGTTMPKGNPGKLTPQEIADLVAYILSRNGFPAGPAELTGDVSALRAIPIDDTNVTPPNPGPAPTRSVLDGVYAEAQSKRGAAVYSAACASCHAPTLLGKDVVPPLVGADFLDHWIGSTAGDLFEHIKSAMPQDKPGTLSTQEYADVLAYMFEKNRFPAGAKELDSAHDALRMIRIETSKKKPQ